MENLPKTPTKEPDLNEVKDEKDEDVEDLGEVDVEDPAYIRDPLEELDPDTESSSSEAKETGQEGEDADTEPSSSETKETGQEELESILNEIRDTLPEEFNQIEKEYYGNLHEVDVGDSLTISEIPDNFLEQWCEEFDTDEETLKKLLERLLGVDDLNSTNINSANTGRGHFLPKNLSYKPEDKKNQREVLHTLYASALKLALQFDEEKDIRETRNSKQDELDSLYDSWEEKENPEEREATLMEEIKEYNEQIAIPQHLLGYTNKEMAEFVNNKLDGETIKLSSEDEEGKYLVYANLENLQDPDFLEELLDTFKRLSKVVEKLEEREVSSVQE